MFRHFHKYKFDVSPLFPSTMTQTSGRKIDTVTLHFLIVAAACSWPALVHGVSMAEVAQHDSPDDCWSAMYGKVFDLTRYAPSHPRRGGGASNVYRLCGIDGTDLYDRYHGNHREWLQNFRSIVEVGPVTEDEPPQPPQTDPPSTSPPTPPATDPPSTIPPTTPSPPTTDPPVEGFVTLDDLAMHNTDDDCWVLYYDTVYDLTVYAWSHPGGEAIIFKDCGSNGTAAYDAYHPKRYLSGIRDNVVGVLDSTSTGPPSRTESPIATEVPTTLEPTPLLTEEPVIGLDEAAEHATPGDCWVAFYDLVYDMTEYAELHPVGPQSIWPTCGTDGTKAYEVFHDKPLLAAVQHYVMGPYQAETQPTPPPGEANKVITSVDLSLHNVTDDCWIVYYGDVYEMSNYIHPEPFEVQSLIKTSCGCDGTRDFAKIHPQAVIKSIKKLKIGKYSDSSACKITLLLSVVTVVGTTFLLIGT